MTSVKKKKSTIIERFIEATNSKWNSGTAWGTRVSILKMGYTIEMLLDKTTIWVPDNGLGTHRTISKRRLRLYYGQLEQTFEVQSFSGLQMMKCFLTFHEFVQGELNETAESE